MNTDNVATPYSSLRESGRINLVNAVPLSGPMAIYVEPTNICNFKCIFCPESFDNYKEKAGGLFQMGLDDFKAIAGQIKAFGTVKTLNFYMMGEPFANKSLIDFISHAKLINIAERVIVTSNGTLIRPERYEAICASGLDYLRVSIYGGNETAHKFNTKSPYRLEKIRENVSGLKSFRDGLGQATPYIYVKMIESKVVAENEDFLRYFENVGDELSLEAVMNWNDPQEGNLAFTETASLLQTKYFAHKKAVCPFPFYTLVIHSDLNVSVCCVDWDKKAVIGNLREESLQEMWRGTRLREFQLKHLQHKRHELSSCQNCTYLHTAPDNLDALLPDTYLDRLSPELG
ncbi:radical SAM/SPASM domain-containing protein [Chitinimonas naiadis]